MMNFNWLILITEIFSITTAAKELENTTAATLEGYIDVLEMSNLIYLAKPMEVGSKGSLKGKPKIFVADAAIRNADDQRWDTVHALGNEEIITPNLDKLARRGTSFVQAHIAGGTCGAVCMPSRAMILSGRKPFYLEDLGGNIPEQHKTLPETFKINFTVDFYKDNHPQKQHCDEFDPGKHSGTLLTDAADAQYKDRVTGVIRPRFLQADSDYTRHPKVAQMREKLCKHRDAWAEQSHPWGVDFRKRF